MIRYYECTACDHKFEKECRIHDKILRKCPKCKRNKLFQDLTGVYGGVRGEPKELIQQAERNSKKLGKYGLQEQERYQRLKQTKEKEDKLKKMKVVDENYKLPDPDSNTWYGKLDKDRKKKIFSGTPKEIKEKQKKYIEHGVSF